MPAIGYSVRVALRAGETRLRNLVARGVGGRKRVESTLPWRNYEAVDGHVFFGYHDISPFHATETRLLAHRAVLDASPLHEPAEVGYFDHLTGCFTTLGKTDLWCWQMGARAALAAGRVCSVERTLRCPDLWLHDRGHRKRTRSRSIAGRAL